VVYIFFSDLVGTVENLIKENVNFRDVFADEPRQMILVKSHLNDSNLEIPSFVAGKHYAENFEKQWQRFKDTQLDSSNGTLISKQFLEQLFGQSLEHLSGKTILEIGAGAGRFTEYFVRYARLVVATDLSGAILFNAALGSKNLVAIQADLLAMPKMKIKFEYVFCRGVLQHTPDPVTAIKRIHDWAKLEGEVIFDIYTPPRLGKLSHKYLWRPVIQRLFTFESFSKFLDRNVDRILRIRRRLKPFLPGISNRVLNYIFPVSDFQGVFPLSEKQLIEWAKMDTLDAMFAVYDNPLKHEAVVNVLNQIGCQIISANPKTNSFRTKISLK